MGLSGLSGLDTLSGLDSLGGDNSSGAQSTPAPATSSGPDWLTGTIAKYVTILLGMALVITGIIFLKPVRETVVTTGKAAATVAAVA